MLKSYSILIFTTILLSGCYTSSSNDKADFSSVDMKPAEVPLSSCGGEKFASLVGQDFPAFQDLDVANDTRYYGLNEVKAYDNPKRLNFVVSTESVVDAIAGKGAKVVKVFCG